MQSKTPKSRTARLNYMATITYAETCDIFSVCDTAEHRKPKLYIRYRPRKQAKNTLSLKRLVCYVLVSHRTVYLYNSHLKYWLSIVERL